MWDTRAARSFEADEADIVNRQDRFGEESPPTMESEAKPVDKVDQVPPIPTSPPKPRRLNLHPPAKPSSRDDRKGQANKVARRRAKRDMAARSKRRNRR